MNLRGSQVPEMMNRVESALRRAASPHQRGPVFLETGGERLGLARLRNEAEIITDTTSGSARRYLGLAVRAYKKSVRRGLRWYVAPLAEQQTRFNHSVLTLVERLAETTDRLADDIHLNDEKHADAIAAIRDELATMRRDLERSEHRTHA